LQAAARIDELIAARWKQENVQPAPLADDAEFVRRVYLDLAGRIPYVAEVRTFLADPSPTKRRDLINTLLDSPGYLNHFSSVWRAWWLPDNNNQFGNLGLRPGFEAWVRLRLMENAGYDAMVRELLTVGTAGAPSTRPIMVLPGGAAGVPPNPQAFLLANENRPENLAASMTRLFLGIRLECAQCHNHFFADWSREQFWEQAAFFATPATVRPAPGQTEPSLGPRRIKIPGTDTVVSARFLDGQEPKWQDGVNPRVVLAEWVTAKDNPWFAKAAVNRLWYYFFGIGLVDPVDDLIPQNPPSHPELLEFLAREFAAHDFDLKFLIRAITNSRTYQLTSAQTHESQADPRLFARMGVKGMSPEQFFDSLALAVGYVDPMPATQRQFAGFGVNTPRARFLAEFKNDSDKRNEVQTSILQALALMNGQFVHDATSVENSELLTAVAQAPFMTTARKIETLYLATLSRPPTPKELARLVKYVESGGPTGDPHKALGDVLWALLNSAEFILNH
jgi:hypothetical protein